MLAALPCILRSQNAPAAGCMCYQPWQDSGQEAVFTDIVHRIPTAGSVLTPRKDLRLLLTANTGPLGD
jgi:hypothetical protein